MALYVSQNVHGGWLAQIWDWFKTTFMDREQIVHTGATEGFGAVLATMKRETAFEQLFGPDAWVRRELNTIETDLSNGLHSLMMETFDRLGVDYRTYVAALGLVG